MDGDLGGLFTSDDDGKNITVHLPEKKYHFDFNFSWLVWIALMLMIVFFRGDPDLHDATIDYIMHKNHKEWVQTQPCPELSESFILKDLNPILEDF
jgi:hypothetical protein